jgi:endonuclease G, mitochondrial
MRKYLLILIMLPVLAYSDYLTVSRPGTVKKTPDKNSDVVFKVTKDDILPLISDTLKNGYYFVKAQHGSKKGWIYKTYVRRYKGSPKITEEVSSDEASVCYAGLPKSNSGQTTFTVLKNIGYWVGYSESYKTPLWSAYRLFKVDNPKSFPRLKKFIVDNRTISKIRHEDYTNSGYDRGHMAPNSAICTRYGEEAQKETFFMSNICPQCPACNEETWQAFEKVEAEKYANEFEEIWSVDGPIFSKNPEKLSCGVVIPEKFFKIIVDEDEDGNVFMLGIIMDQTTKGQHQIKEFIATVDSIETLTGLDFFSELPDSIEKIVESSLPENETWDLNQDLNPTFHVKKQIKACEKK